MTAKSSNLHAVWSAPDNSRLTSKQYSFRLPVHVAAKLGALCEMYPQRTRTEIVGDLLASAIDDLARNLPAEKGKYISRDNETGLDVYVARGPAADFRQIANRHFRDLETELGNEKTTPLFVGDLFLEESPSGESA